MAKERLITNSEISTYRACPAKWGFNYADGLEPVAQEISAASWGTVAHAGMAAYCLALQAGRGQIEAKADALAVVAETGKGGPPDAEQASDITGALTVLLDSDPFAGHEIVAVEKAFSFPIIPAGEGGPVLYAGQIDLITIDRATGELVVWDHKFTDNVHSYEAKTALDTQSVGYVWAALQMEFPQARGRGTFRWSVARRKSPRLPTVLLLKKAQQGVGVLVTLKEQEDAGRPLGTVSAAQVDTTAAIYAEALSMQVERGLAVTQEQEVRFADLQRLGSNWHQIIETFITSKRIKEWEQQTLVQIARIRLAEVAATERTRSPEACGMFACRYNTICKLDAPETRALYKLRAKRPSEIQQGIK
jgi:hypothetical protein